MQINKTEFQAQIEYYMKRRGFKGLNELAEYTGICYKTLLKYMKDPERFPLWEVGRMAEELRMPVGEFLEKVIKNGGDRKNEAEEDLKKISMRRAARGDLNRRPPVNLADIRPGSLSRVKN